MDPKATWTVRGTQKSTGIHRTETYKKNRNKATS